MVNIKNGYYKINSPTGLNGRSKVPEMFSMKIPTLHCYIVHCTLLFYLYNKWCDCMFICSLKTNPLINRIQYTYFFNHICQNNA